MHPYLWHVSTFYGCHAYSCNWFPILQRQMMCSEELMTILCMIIIIVIASDLLELLESSGCSFRVTL